MDALRSGGAARAIAMTGLDLDSVAERFAQASDFTVGVEEEKKKLDRDTLELSQRLEEMRDSEQETEMVVLD